MGTQRVSIASFLPPSLRSHAVPRQLPHAHTASAGLLFADISGFTALTEKLAARGREGAEEIAAVVNAAFAPAIRAIEKHGGSIESFGGDALFAAFSDPGGAARAVAAAKQIAASFTERSAEATSVGPVRLGVSQGVHHGKVGYLHLGDHERRQYIVSGTAVAELARLEAKASGGKLLVSPAARWRVVEASRATASLRAAAPVLAELRTYLPARLAPALEGFEGEYRKVAILFLETRGQGLAALQAWYLRLCEVLDGYEGLLLKSDLSAAGTKWVSLFGIPRAHEEDPDRAVRAFCQAIAKERPRLYVLEDMHWADGASSEAAEWLAKGAADAAYVVLLLHRPGYEKPKDAAEVVLHDLGEDAVEKLLEAHLGMVPATVSKLVNERAGGNPFYVEEVVRHLLEAGILGMSDKGYELVREVRAEDLPESIETLIAARLDRLSADVKKVAQHAAVIGRSFLFELLAHLPQVAGLAEAAVDDLCHRELTFELRRDPHLEYIWKHALTRDVAYEGILAAKRRQLHRAVADAIETVLGKDGFLAMLGHHREQAGQKEAARACYLAGAREAAGRYAHEEAEKLYRSYLGLVEEETEDSIMARIELGAKVLRLCGRMSEAEALHREAVDLARTMGQRRT